MTKTVVLMRHASSQLEQFGKPDRERTITMSGMLELDYLRPQLPNLLKSVDLVLCSNVKRTRQTLEAVRQSLPARVDEKFDDGIYQATADVLWHKIQTTSPAYNHIMIICHNPALTNILKAIDPTQRCDAFPTSSLAFIEADVARWSEFSMKNCVLKQFIVPNI
ncbi:MAG: hypothetical protein C0440_03140 [Candidatus Pelagibacter sp.]|nr:hypothetical protein [Candidatus Pelagibacter sp.]